MSRQSKNLWVMITVMCASVMYDPVMAGGKDVKVENKAPITSAERRAMIKKLYFKILKYKKYLKTMNKVFKKYAKEESRLFRELENNPSLQDEYNRLNCDLDCIKLCIFDFMDELIDMKKIKKKLIDDDQISRKNILDSAPPLSLPKAEL